MKKKALAMALALVLCLSLLPSGVLAAFSDVPSGTWYSDAVSYVYDKGIMTGVSSSEFNPGANMTRAQLCQILYNMEGKPSTRSSTFIDVSQNDWFYNAVVWAASNSIVSGVGNNSFAPNNLLSREQTATLLYRYAQYKDYDVSGTVSLDAFSDAGQISSWAMTAMQWAVGEAYISGTSETTLTPGGTATRAQIAVIIMRFCQKSEAYAEFKAKDIEDFEGYEVINFDDSNETNFAVLTEDAVASESTTNRNQLVEANEDEGVYVFSNIDQKISSLAPGDVFYIAYGTGDDDYLLLKVGSIKIDGSSATITEGKASLSDYFQYIDFDMDIDIPNADLGSNVSTLEESDLAALAGSVTGSAGGKIKFGIITEAASINGSADLTLTVKISYDEKILGFDVEEISFSVKNEMSLEAKLSEGKKAEHRDESKPLTFPITTGVDLELQVYFEATASSSVSGSLKGTVTTETGTKYSNGTAAPIRKSEGDVSLSVDGNFNLSAGVGIEGKIVLLKVIRLSLGAEGGIELDGKAEAINISTNQNEKHICAACVDGAMDFYFKTILKGKAGISDKCSVTLVDWNPTVAKIKFGDFYISFLGGTTSPAEFGWGKCPHKQYLLTIRVVDQNNNPIPDATVLGYTEGAGQVIYTTTDSNGTVTNYCDNGVYSISVSYGDFIDDNKEVTIKGSAASVVFTLERDTEAQYLLTKVTQNFDNGEVYLISIDFPTYSRVELYGLTDFWTEWATGVWHENGVTREYSYDANGRAIREVTHFPEWDNGGYYVVVEYTYDSNGNILSETVSRDGDDSYTTKYTYDSNGNMIRLTFLHMTAGNSEITCTYDSNGRMLTQSMIGERGSGYTYTYTYDSNGRCIKKLYNENQYHEDVTYAYDSNGRLATEKAVTSSGSTYTTSYTYDNHGNMTSKVYSSYDSTLGTTSSGAYRYDNTYDSHGNLTEVHMTSDSNNQRGLTLTYEYELR